MGDKRKYSERQRDKRKEQERRENNGKTIYEQVINGEIEPQGRQKGWTNLKPISFGKGLRDAEKEKEICRKGAKAVQEIRGKKKTAKEVLENLLTLKATDELMASAELSEEMIDRLRKGTKDATLYDVLGAVAVGRALDGNVKAMEFIRDTRGDAPIKEMRLESDIMTDQDRALLQEVARRLEDKEIVVVKDIGPDGK